MTEQSIWKAAGILACVLIVVLIIEVATMNENLRLGIEPKITDLQTQIIKLRWRIGHVELRYDD